MPVTFTATEKKEQILSIIKKNGPSLPIQIAKLTNTNSLFSSAFLSELYGEGKLKISNLKVGSSPLYYIPGQEPMLENFVQHLNNKEKESFMLLKENLVLEDEKQHPAIRVALRAIKDFAIPIKVKHNDDTKLFWKFFLLSDEEAKSLIEKILSIKPDLKEDEKKNKEEIKTETITLKEKSESEKQKTKIRKKPKEIILQSNAPESQTHLLLEKKEKLPVIKNQQYEFPHTIKKHLTAKGIEILESLLEKKKDFIAIARIDTVLGKQEFLMIAKNKKKMTENDVTLAVQQAQTKRMPAILVSMGDLDKKASQLLNEWKNLLKFEKVNL